MFKAIHPCVQPGFNLVNLFRKHLMAFANHGQLLLKILSLKTQLVGKLLLDVRAEALKKLFHSLNIFV
jgi:hypothetical protein